MRPRTSALTSLCRWASLPDLYSHYGSRGIVVSTFLQSWSQGVDVWGESGMRKLFSTANVVTYGGNVKEEGYLKMLSELIGKYTYTSVSSSRQKDSGSTSRQDATQMFFELLVLGTKDAIKVEQAGSSPALPIRVRGKRGLWGNWTEVQTTATTTDVDAVDAPASKEVFTTLQPTISLPRQNSTAC